MSNGFAGHVGGIFGDGQSLAGGIPGNGWIADFKYDKRSERLVKTWVEPFDECFFCETSLDPRYDYFCIICGRQACDSCSQACHVLDVDCDMSTCASCANIHLQTSHPEAWNQWQSEETSPP